MSEPRDSEARSHNVYATAREVERRRHAHSDYLLRRYNWRVTAGLLPPGAPYDATPAGCP